MKNGWGWLLLGLGVGLSAGVTWACVTFGLDWRVARFFEQRPMLIAAGVPGVFAGMVVPLAMVAFYFFRTKKQPSLQNKELLTTVLSGFLMTFLTSTLLKAMTSRVDMEPFEPLGPIDFSGTFRFGWLQGNSLWESLSEGWPSGHTMIATYFWVTLMPIRNKAGNRAHFLYVVWIMLSVVTAFHWLSDVLSGLILGTIIGKIFQVKTTRI